MNNSDSKKTLMEYTWGDVATHPKVEEMIRILVELMGLEYNPSYLTSHGTYISYGIPAVDEDLLVIDDLIIVFINDFINYISIVMYFKSHEYKEKIQYPVNRIRGIFEIIQSELNYITTFTKNNNSFDLNMYRDIDDVTEDIIEILKDKKEIIDLLDI